MQTNIALLWYKRADMTSLHSMSIKLKDQLPKCPT